jgi:hypothetical protein
MRGVVGLCAAPDQPIPSLNQYDEDIGIKCVDFAALHHFATLT